MLYDDEKGIDAGGLTREMYSQFAAQTLEMPAEKRIFRATAANRLAPEPCTPDVYGDECERQFVGYGRVCGMALAMGELSNFSFAPFFLRQVLFPDATPSVEEMLEVLREDDPELVRSMEVMLKTAVAESEAQPTPDGSTIEDLCLTFERRMSTSQEVLGEDRSIPLLPAGEEMDVTVENARSFVERYLDYKIRLAILPQSQAFRTGVLDVLQEPGPYQ